MVVGELNPIQIAALENKLISREITLDRLIEHLDEVESLKEESGKRA